MGFSLEYVASGFTGTKCYNKEFIEKPEFVSIIVDFFKRINRKDHGFSVLFNALTDSEAEMRKLNEHFRSGLHSIHSDSGGLQMITLGLASDPKTKPKVYDRQARFSDVAMSFDEIPIKTMTERAIMGVTSLRRFDRENLKEYAVKSAENLIEQIESFQKTPNNRAKPLAIIHGNDIDSYCDFANFMFDAIPSHLHEQIGGLSISGQSIGEGTIEAVERAFASAIIPHNDKNVMHLLGVGSMTRILPYLALMVSGVFKDGLHLSYDSTTHSGGLVRREYIDKKLRRLKPGKNYNRVWEHAYNDAVRMFPHIKTHVPNAKVFYDAMEWDAEGRKGNEETFLMTNFGFLCATIENFKIAIDEALHSHSKLIEMADESKMARIIDNLTTLRDRKDFMEWKNSYGMHYSTDRIQDVSATSTLDEFFI